MSRALVLVPTTNVPPIAFPPSGPVAPAGSAILTGAIADIAAAFATMGFTLTFTNADGTANLKSPQGQLASSLAAIILDKDDQFLALSNNFDPTLAAGIWQDALGRIYFIARFPAEPTTVNVTCSGATGKQILLGTTIIAQDGNFYMATAPGTIPASGYIVLPFACVTTGPIACPPQTFTISPNIPGFDSAVSTAAGALGSVVEGQAAFEARRSATVANNANGTLPAILANVLLVPGVLDAYVLDNATNGTVTVGGVSLAANSLYVCVAGGNSALDVALAIWQKKTAGCSYSNPTITETITDPSPIYAPGAAPNYLVGYTLAISTPIYITVKIFNSTAVPSNALALIQAVVMLAFSGADGGQRARIGAKLGSSRYFAGIIGLGVWAQVDTILIGTSASPTGTSVQMNINQVPVIAPAQITLVLE